MSVEHIGNGYVKICVSAAELGKYFDTAIDAMTMLLAGFKEESEAQNEE